MNLLICINIFLIIFLGIFTDLSVSKRVTEVGFNLFRLRFWKTEYGSKFILVLRLSKVFLILCFLIK